MTALLDVILPVFMVIGFGYAAARFGLFSDSAVDGLMRFAQNFAVPCLLFRSIATLDLSGAYNTGLLVSFYIGAFTGFALCFAGARWLFHRPLTDCVAIGFAGLFSNSLLLGLPITERAYGVEALQGNFAIISVHSPMLYGFGIGLMEWARTRGQGLSAAALSRQIGRAVFSQPLVIGIALGFIVNLSGLPLPGAFWAGVDLMTRAAIPAALFGLGGVLLRYKPEGDRATIAMVCAASLIVHPGVTWVLGSQLFTLDTASLRSAVVTAAMAPGVNAYLFAHMYGVAKRVNASAVLIGTALSIGSVWMWLAILP
ncbi:AEC family transporter [Pseudotabrizicola formosa]|uniref:AEC family transporter n=1 Tax=Pseudotabrizicola formosa TaxID=2030009 RepID=UPI000CD177E1|nr:AEC family transporter [Pseudotabrizicola formosa]